jgi:hypothetical protein
MKARSTANRNITPDGCWDCSDMLQYWGHRTKGDGSQE